MKRQFILIFACALALTACDDDVSGAPKNSNSEEISHVVDTLYLSSKDTVVIKDSVLLKDTVVLKDSVLFMDTVILKDSILLKDTVYIIDSLTKGDTSCVVTDQGVSFKIQCKDKVPYILNKATCNGKAYDPAIDLCNKDTILAIADADTCKGVIYDSRDYFCSASEKVVAKCDGKTYDADSLFCYLDKETGTYSTPKRCGGLEYDINKYECEKGVVIDYCGETKYNAILVGGCREDENIPFTHCSSGIAYPISGGCFPSPYCKRFDGNDCVECKEGFSGTFCEYCEEGYYGLDCDRIVTCVHGEKDNTIFAKSGVCVPGNCEKGYYGENCNMEVSCEHGRQDNRTTARSGLCVGSCDTGYFGSSCNRVITCQHGEPNDDIYGDGQCKSCNLGYYGLDCDKTVTCEHGTPDDGINGSGKCIEGSCLGNYTGENCDIEL